LRAGGRPVHNLTDPTFEGPGRANPQWPLAAINRR